MANKYRSDIMLFVLITLLKCIFAIRKSESINCLNLQINRNCLEFSYQLYPNKTFHD